MRLFPYLICYLILGIIFPLRAAFLPMTEDIPLMDGITLEDSDTFSFDTPSGQILMLDGTTRLSSDKIRTFYKETLIGLGWQRQDSDTFTRGHDTFRLTFPKSNHIRFDITFGSVP